MDSSWKFKIAAVSLVLLSAAALTGFGCRPQSPGGNIASDVELTIWGLWQESGHIAPAIASFEQSTGAKVTYKKIASVAEYEKKLLSALAIQRGPDIFVIHHTWVNSKQDLISPAPGSVIDERALRESIGGLRLSPCRPSFGLDIEASPCWPSSPRSRAAPP